MIRLAALSLSVTLATVMAASPSHSEPMPTEHRSPTVEMAVLHAVPAPDEYGIDVYANKTRVAQGINSGDLASLRVKPGRYDFRVVPTGSAPNSTDALAALNGVSIDADTNSTLAVHLSRAGRVTASLFENKTRTVGRDLGRLTFRNIADAPKVDVRSRGRTLMTEVGNAEESTLGIRSGDYRVRIVREGTREQLVPVSTHSIVNAPGRQDMGDNRIIYLWGSAADRTLDIAIQEIPLDLS